ncbi:PD-(D/E)XK nuclease family protein [uncultured Clostridium sp.]|uniref:PD-(D/E)XK nuclease family protein n=1 Tax=uncultured Clostridium sp. TaxID=59620 RepID=UPI003216981E
MGREKNERLQKLFDKNIPVYSYSKLDAWDGCKYNWYHSYILHERSKDNIYSIIGGVIHDSLEDIYINKSTLQEAKNVFNKTVRESEEKGIKFPENPPTTKINYIKNMNNFFENYKVMDTKMITEQFVLLKIPRFDNAINDEDFIWIQMYIDSIMPVLKNGEFSSVIINDWKSSSKFDKDKLRKASKQLLIYKMGVEQSTNVKVSSLGWTMLKYCYCCYRTKGSKTNPSQIKKSMQERKDSIKWFSKKIIGDLIKDGMDTIEAELLMGKAINQSTMSIFSKEIQDRYWIEDCFLECEFNDELIEDCEKWIIKTVTEIESIEHKIENYPSVEINDKTSYFCHNLCGRPNCIHLLKYKNDNKDNFKRLKSENKINKLSSNNKKLDLDSLFK